MKLRDITISVSIPIEKITDEDCDRLLEAFEEVDWADLALHVVRGQLAGERQHKALVDDLSFEVTS